MRFRTVIADVPWHYVYFSGDNGVPCREGLARDRYPTMPTAEICALGAHLAPVLHRDCTMLFWATWPKLADAVRVIEAWGFEPKTGLPWLKMSRAGCPRVGLGYHAQSCSEPLLIATQGTPGVPKPGRRPVGVIFNPIGEHSAKPDAQYDLAEGYSPPYLELFARPDDGLFPPRKGWWRAGNGVDGRDIREALRDLAALPEPVAPTPVLPSASWAAQAEPVRGPAQGRLL